MVIEIVIKQVGTEWAIEPKDDVENKKRFGRLGGKIDDEWNSRRPKKARDKNHTPIAFEEGNVLEFTCPDGHPFAVGAKKIADVDEFPGAPDNPFGGPDFRTGKGVESPVSAPVITASDAPGPRHQRFYKFHGWVRVGDKFIAVDPDGYCGG